MKKIITAVLILAISGCAVQKTYNASGGSKSDGIVKLSYTVGSMQKAVVSEQQGLDKAIGRCKRWGYTSAEAFEMVSRTCNSYYNGNCNVYLVTKEYQCE